MNFKAETKRIAKLIEVGLEKLALGEPGNALLEFESALFFDSENLAANLLAATCLLRLDRPIEAEALALKAVALAPDLATAHLAAAEVLAAAGRNAEAEFHLLEAVSKEPYNAGLRIEWARFLILADRAEEACDQLRRALEISPKDATGRLLLALELADQNRWSEAESQIESLGKLEKVDASLLGLAGWLRIIRADDLHFSGPKLEEYKRAAKLLTRANQIDQSIEFIRELLAISSEAIERVSKPVEAQFKQPSRFRRVLLAVAVIVYVISFSGGFLWLANLSISAAMLGGLCTLALYLVVLVVLGLMRRDFSFLPPALFMFIDRATKGGLTRWSNPVVTELFSCGECKSQPRSS